MIGPLSVPIHATPTPTSTPGLETTSGGDLVTLGGIIIFGTVLFGAFVVWLHTVTGGRLP